jgi:hypothetical protein
LLYNRAVVVENKSSSLLKINFTNTQTLQLFMIYFNQKLIIKDNKNAWVLRYLEYMQRFGSERGMGSNQP